MTLASRTRRRFKAPVARVEKATAVFGVAGLVSLGLTSLVQVTTARAGWLLVLSHIADVLAVTWLCWLAISLGLGLIRGAPRVAAIPRVCVALVLGLVGISTLILLAGLMGVLRPMAWVVLPVSAVLVSIANWPAQAVRLFKEVVSTSRVIIASSALVWVVFLLLTGILVLFALQPVQDFDSLMYHLLIPSEWLDAGRLFLPDDSFHAAFIGAVQMLNIPFEVFDVRSGPSLLQIVPVLAAAFLTADTAARHAGKATSPLAFSLMIGSSALMIMAFVPRIDGWLVLAVAIVHFLMLDALAAPGCDEGSWSVVGAVAGAAFAIKYQAIPFVAAAALTVAVVSVVKRRRLPGRAVVSAAGIGLAVATPWLMKNILLIGSPLYPFFSEPLTWGWLEAVAPGYEVGKRFRPLAEAREPFNLVAWVLDPGSLFMQRDGHLGGLHPMMLLAPLGLVSGSRRLVAAAIAMSAGGVAITVAVSASTNLRYLVPAFSGLAFSAAIGLTWLLDRITVERRHVYLLVVTAIILLPSAYWIGTRVMDGALPYAVGADSEAIWSTRPENLQKAELVSLDDWLSEEGARRTLLLWENRVAGFESDVVQNVSQTNWPHLWTALAGQCPSGDVFTHVVVNQGFRDFLIGRGMDPVGNHLGEFERFAERCLDFIGFHATDTSSTRSPGSSRLVEPNTRSPRV